VKYSQTYLLLVLFLLISSSAIAGQLMLYDVEVLSGDEFSGKANGYEYKIRIYGVDAPEPGQDYSSESFAFLKKTVEKNLPLRVLGECDPRTKCVSHVFGQSGWSLSHLTAKAGTVWAHRNEDGDKLIASYIKKARTRKVGLWADPNSIAPWMWRKGVRSISQ
jgi:endonuclease YncB( thermonuclease family)